MIPKIGQRWRWQQFETDLIFEITNVTQDKVYGNVVFVKSGYRDNNSSVDFYPWRFEPEKIQIVRYNIFWAKINHELHPEQRKTFLNQLRQEFQALKLPILILQIIYPIRIIQ